MNKNETYKPLLEKYIKRYRPGRILEWGPGKSTEIMAKTWPTTPIVTVEHDKKWYDRAIERLSPWGNVQVICHRIGKNRCKYAIEGYNHAPVDIAFIDGRRRVECCFVAMDILSPGGVVILHDSNRQAYRRIIDRYIDIKDEADNTLVFTRSDCIKNKTVTQN